MIEEGDRVAVGVSGGKDSLALLCALAEMRKFYPKRFSLKAVSVNVGFPDPVSFDKVRELAGDLDVEYSVVDTEIYSIVFEEKKEKRPCSLCATLRRGALNSEAMRIGCNKIALGHHMEDAAGTALLRLLYEGTFGSFCPVTYYPDNGISVIRPFIYTSEKLIRSFAKKAGLPVVASTCPENGNTEREAAHEFLREKERESKGVCKRVIGALEKAGADGWHI
ncbi:MAG: tRNA 2-thiocytidine biosynthesis protein TtcA [Clostridia bacterium]|nr:tRNA 2-thiocytidine biosynthesis protein TtcA [Clostridia bacterium]